MFSKWFIVCMLLSSVWIYLTLIGQGIFKDVPKRLAWLLPLGPNPWEQTTRLLVPHGTPLSEVIAKLGQPNEISEPLIGGNVQHLKYINPHDESRYIVVTIGPDGNVINATASFDSAR